MQIGSMGGSGLAEMLQQMQQKTQTAFSNADTDGDGKLSKTEFSAFDTAMKADAPQGVKGAKGTAPSADDMFSKLDTDGDGSVTLAEIQTNAHQPPALSADSMSALLQLQEANGSSINPFLEALKAADVDGDGQLSETEFSAFENTIKAQITGAGSTTATADTGDDTAQTATVGGASGGGGGGGKTYDPLDTNKDGTVSAEELAAANNPMSTTTTGDLLTSLIKNLLSNYTQGGTDAISALTGAGAVDA